MGADEMDIKKLPESELEVMLAVWELGDGATSEAVMKLLHKGWKKTTLLSLLTRLCERGFLSCEKRGKINYYSPLVKKEDYLKTESARLLRFCSNSVTRLVASLYDGEAIDKNDLEELEKFIREAKEC